MSKKTVEETRRELFERIAASSGWSIAPKQDRLRGILEPRQYHSPATQMAWEGFNAALDAVAIELPQAIVYDDHEGLHLVALGQCRAAIESTNLGIKVK